MVGVTKKRKNQASKEVEKKRSSEKKPSSCLFSCQPILRVRPVQPSFFKIMIGNFMDVLFIPPKLTNILVDLLDQTVILQDYYGNCSSVKVSMVDNSLAFEEGWHDFVLNHSIDIGEILLFAYVGESLFSVQIFGINACERVTFGKQNYNNYSKESWNCANLSPERLEFIERSKSAEAPHATEKENGHSKADDHVTKFLLAETKQPENSNSSQHYCNSKSLQLVDPYGSAGPVAKAQVEDGNEHEIAHQYCCESETSQNMNGVDITRPPVNIISGHAIRVEERGNCPVEQVNACSFGGKERIETEFHSQYVSSMPSVKEIFSSQEVSHSRSQTTLKACTRFDYKNQIASSRDTILFTPDMDIPIPSNITKEQLVGENWNDLRGYTTFESDVIKLIAAEEIVSRFLLTEDGICHIVNEYIDNGLGAFRGNPDSLSATDFVSRISFSDYVNMFRDASQCERDPNVNFLSPVVDYAEYRTTNRMRGKETGNSSVQDEKEDSPCLRRHDHQLVKVNDKDLDNLYLSSSCCLSLTSTYQSQYWIVLNLDLYRGLKYRSATYAVNRSFCHNFAMSEALSELPQALPSCKSKKKNENKVVILRDPSLRVWPVLYMENAKVVGFTAGWKDFAKANNLQQGDLCEFVCIANDDFENTFHVQITRS